MIFHGRFRYRFFTSKPADSDTDFRFPFFFIKQQTRMKESIHKQDVYLVFNRPNWVLAIENNNCNHLKLTLSSAVNTNIGTDKNI